MVCQSALVWRPALSRRRGLRIRPFLLAGDNLAPDACLDEALRLLASSIPLGMLVFRDLQAQLDDPAEHAFVESFLDYLASLGLDLRLYMPQMTAA